MVCFSLRKDCKSIEQVSQKNGISELEAPTMYGESEKRSNQLFIEDILRIEVFIVSCVESIRFVWFQLRDLLEKLFGLVSVLLVGEPIVYSVDYLQLVPTFAYQVFGCNLFQLNKLSLEKAAYSYSPSSSLLTFHTKTVFLCCEGGSLTSFNLCVRLTERAFVINILNLSFFSR